MSPKRRSLFRSLFSQHKQDNVRQRSVKNLRIESLESRQLLAADFTLELLHIADQEAAVAAIQDAPRLSAVLNSLRSEDVADSTLTLSSGDAFIPGLFYDASESVFGSGGIADIQIQNELGIQAVALGNHEFDFGTANLAGLIDGSTPGDFSALAGSTLVGLDFTGTDFPYLSANLDFSTDANLAPLEISGGQAPQGGVVTSSTVIQMPGNGDSMAVGENGFSVTPIFTVTETFSGTTGALNSSTAGDYTPPGILDGIGAYEFDSDTVRVFATHELVDGDGYAYSLANGTSITGARISYFDIDKTTRQIVDAGLAYDTIYNSDGTVLDDVSDFVESRSGFTRFCSAVLVQANGFGAGRGLADTIFFAGEETGGDISNVSGGEWALDVSTGQLWSVPAMGRGAWENVTEVDTGTTTHVAFVLMDDTSPFDADGDSVDEAAPMYMYVGEKNSGTGGFLDRNGLENGKLYVWVADDAAIKDPSDFNGALNNVPQAGTWVEIDNSQDLAMVSEDGSTGYDEYGYPTQKTLWTRAEALGAFGFSRPEDIATNPSDGSEFVFASTGRSSDFGGADRIGTLYTATVDFSSITTPKATVTIIYDGDQDPTQALRSPDNLDWADDGWVYVQEDRAIGGIFGPGAVNPHDASILAVNPADGSVVRVAEINQDVTRGAVDENVASTGQQDIGDWESSGIVDVSTLFGEAPGTLFLFDVQAHALDDQGRFAETAGTPAARLVDSDLKEGGQLAFLSRGADLGETVETVGVIGATTPTLASISSPGDLTVSPEPFAANPSDAELDALAAEIQTEVDALLAANPTMNKVIVLSHMQRLNIELELAERLSNVDIIVAGGSNTRLFDADDRPRSGDSDQGEYPQFVTNADGTSTAVVNTDGSYKYVGRLVIGFDAAGNIDPTTYDAAVSGAYATDAQGVTDLGAGAMVDPEIQAIVDAVEAQIVATESNVFGVSDVFLNGNRSGVDSPSDPDGVRTQETNLGNLTADANLAAAQAADGTVMVSLKNGGGIRASIGQVVVPPGGTDAVRLPNEAVIDSSGIVVKPEGGISQNDIATTLAFNNGLVLMTLTQAELVGLLEHGVSAIPGVSGRFPQISGLRFSYDPALPVGSRIVNAAVYDEDGVVAVSLVENGDLVDTGELIRLVTLDFLASPRFDASGNFVGGGDGYPFPNTNSDPAVGEVASAADLARIDFQPLEQAIQTGDATFADDGTEQDALAEYLNDVYPDAAKAFGMDDTGRNWDNRIVNLQFRSDSIGTPVSDPTLAFSALSTFSTGVFDESAAEIVSYDPVTQRVFYTNAFDNVIGVLDISDPANPVAAPSINPIGLPANSGGINSVDVSNGLVAAAVAADDHTENGIVIIYDTDGTFKASVEVGALPDSLSFSPDGMTIVVANEGEPGDLEDPNPAVDPMGSISVIDLTDLRAGGFVTDFDVTTIDFTSLDGQEDALRAEGIRIFPGRAASVDLEPEFVTITPDNSMAVVTLQEANAIAMVDLTTKTLVGVEPLGTKDHSIPGNGLDASNRDDEINIRPWPVQGLYMPDAITSFEQGGQTYFVTANEGDSRDFDESRIGSLTLDPTAFPDAAFLQDNENLGRLKVSNIDGDIDGDGDFDELYSYGSRSFTIWNTDGEVVFDSGNQFETITADLIPFGFNATNDENEADNRSDDKGPEPEAVTIGQFGDRTLAFIGLERVGGIMIYDVTDPSLSSFVGYLNNRDFNIEPSDDLAGAGDLGVEDLEYIPSDQSPNGQALIVASNEVSGTVSIFALNEGSRAETQLVVVSAPTADDSTTLPSEIDTVPVGGTYYVEVWVRDLDPGFNGLSGGHVDLSYDTNLLDATGIVHQDFDILPSGTIDDSQGMVDDLGGGTFEVGRGADSTWSRLAYVEVVATGAGEETFMLDPGRLQFGRLGGGGNIPWRAVDLSDTATVTHLDAPGLQLRVVDAPSDADGDGEATEIPPNSNFVNEFETFYVEVWMDAAGAQGVDSATLSLDYNTAITSASAIIPGPGFSLVGGTINDAAGTVSNLSVTADRLVGDDNAVLLATVEFSRRSTDSVILDPTTGNVTGLGLDLEVTDGSVGIGGVSADAGVGTLPNTELFAMPYDFDNNGSIDFGDYAHFRDAFGRSVGDPEPPFAAWADFDGSGMVDFEDFDLLEANFGLGIGDARFVFADGFPNPTPSSSTLVASSMAEGEGLREAFLRSGPFHNYRDPTDVNNSGQTTALDALQIITALYQERDNFEAFLDVSGDGTVSGLDAVRVINRLNQNQLESEFAPFRSDYVRDQSSDVSAADQLESESSLGAVQVDKVVSGFAGQPNKDSSSVTVPTTEFGDDIEIEIEIEIDGIDELSSDLASM
ncbi:choice-of-anchor I family protein [Novipirellula artificiosorum]|uniref:Trifunctional nucleotide phosphoesterase protein YfkN n=1 Tax=Novipirellula artificiosorum TaxID=2528016 RepID=A0A5C6CU18_9BACT|nr:choice-of-anchor I family protein [Novipirellula artificiosorum]TWU27908.1 Trifunctional nucleotide phosphoesterase protein YfkN precursor [Novipirellula artificiosorum]